MLIFNIVLTPALAWVAKNSPPPQRLARIAATVCLFVAVSVAWEVREWPENFFQKLEIPRGSPKHMYHKAYKAKAKILHPDRNPDNREAAEEAFIKMREMYDALKDERVRRVYDRFGAKFVESPHYEQWLESPSSMAFFYMSYYFGMTFLISLLCWDQKSAAARNWCFFILIVMLVYEIIAKHDDDDWDYLHVLLPYWTLHQKVELMHLILMYVFHLASQYAAATYVDIEQNRFDVLHFKIEQLGAMTFKLMEDMEALKKRQGIKADDVSNEVAGKELQRRRKVEEMKRAQQGPEVRQVQQEGGGTNWLQLIVVGSIIYSYWTGKN